MVQPVEPPHVGMYCMGCGYNLHGLPQPRCPECSRAFDPADATTFWPRRPRRNRLLLLLTTLAVGYPVVFVSSLYLTWIAGWMELGRTPRYYLDDPKGIHGLVDLLYPLPHFVGWAMCPAFCLALFAGAHALSQWRRIPMELSFSTREGRRCTLAILAAWLGGVVVSCADPLGVVRWYVD